jgi:hypothetical protein
MMHTISMEYIMLTDGSVVVRVVVVSVVVVAKIICQL